MGKWHQSKLAIMMLSGVIMLVMAVMPVSAAELTPDDRQTVLDTMEDLHLSAERFEIETGEIYQIEVLPKEHAAPLGWEFGEINLGEQNDLLELLEPDALEAGMLLKRFDDAGRESVQTYSETEAAQSLCFFVRGKRSGTVTLTVELTNPGWEDTFGEVLPKVKLVCNASTVSEGTKAAKQAQAIQEALEAQIRLSGGTEDTDTYVTENAAAVSDSNGPGTDVPGFGGDPANKPNPPASPAIVPGEGGQDITVWIDRTSLWAIYDGAAHAPKLNLPAGYTAGGIAGAVDAGSYTDEIVVKAADGNTVGTATVTYVIEPAVITVAHLYDASNNTVVTDVRGIVDGDIIAIRDNGGDVNAAGTDISKTGRYEISTVVEIDEAKIGNYVVAGDGNTVSKSDAYTVKGNNPWYEVNMDYRINENTNQLTVNFYLENLRTEQVGKNASRLLTLEICVYYDTELLEYSGKTNQYNNWRVDYYKPDEHNKVFAPDPITGLGSGVAPDLTISYTGMCKGLAGDGVKTQICSITYDIVDGDIEALTNSVIRADEINYDAFFELGAGKDNNDIPAKYWADPAYVVINPDGSFDEHEIIIEADPVETNMTPHQSTCGPITLQEIKDALHDYIDGNMTETKPLTPSDSLPEESGEAIGVIEAGEAEAAEDAVDIADAADTTDGAAVDEVADGAIESLEAIEAVEVETESEETGAPGLTEAVMGEDGNSMTDNAGEESAENKADTTSEK